jgi:hypothetical protein
LSAEHYSHLRTNRSPQNQPPQHLHPAFIFCPNTKTPPSQNPISKPVSAPPPTAKVSTTSAGAESQVISLWKVADTATKDLMINYYTRIKANEGRNTALHNMLNSKNYSHPYYWAAFIPSGDWHPLNP